MIEFESVSKTYKPSIFGSKITALKNLTIKIEEGEVFGFLGPNGAGKSTTIKILMDFIRPTSGRVTVNSILSTMPEARTFIGYLPENPCFYDHLSAKDLLWFGARVAGIKPREARHRINILLERVGLSRAANRPMCQYSKGMAQRAGLALALIHDPKIIILDEPMSGLDPLGRKLVADLILELKKEGKTVFFSSHIISDIEKLCDRIGILVKGKLQLLDTIPNIYANYSSNNHAKESRYSIIEDIFVSTVKNTGGNLGGE